MKPYFLYNGIKELVKTMKGDENIYLGIRPYGFHAGNASTLVIYPIILCTELEKLGKKAQFKFNLFLNDWEQDSLDGPNPRLYPFNIMPKFTTWQYMPDPIDSSKKIVDYWEKVIVNNINLIKHYFPAVQILPIKNSEMKHDKEMKHCVLHTIDHPEQITHVMRQYTNKKVLNMHSIYSSAVCPDCHAARGNSCVVANSDKIIHHCINCGITNSGKYEDFNYWLYHKPLAIPRIISCKIDLCITGSDHYNEGDFAVRQKLFEIYGYTINQPKTLYTPSVFGEDKQVMGKSKGNARLIDLDKLLNLVLTYKNNKKIIIPDKI